MTERRDALSALMEASFVLTELTEYLDTHPTCPGGLARYQQAEAELEAAKLRYSAENNMLPVCDGMISGWSRVQTPWPWEMEE